MAFKVDIIRASCEQCGWFAAANKESVLYASMSAHEENCPCKKKPVCSEQLIFDLASGSQ